jgi:hypothetical protein
LRELLRLLDREVALRFPPRELDDFAFAERLDALERDLADADLRALPEADLRADAERDPPLERALRDEVEELFARPPELRELERPRALLDARPREVDDRRDPPLLCACAVWRETSLLKLLCCPRAVCSW